ncbi:MAG TPA: UDP-N-acetylglucosamine 1-carboxyvinyltransferase [Caldithrix abyssi]|uniref:UDP-N-acetylglucosamine 1-carboxyvinyltransferase n=1 Tax=Caldithrix abyssi TaxID=187145 RepID=A0A7V4U017_CALAY|nr:UDP-N-acetylglucosamine 1-carboxyvinyltransferase [Caldithrix abyssi]
MAKFIIEGGYKLSGRIKVAGNKNAALPIIAATVLTDETCCLYNVPEIKDVHIMLHILKDLGKQIEREGPNSYIVSGTVNKTRLNMELAGKLRASILFLSGLLARFGEAEFPPPGGCVIGRRNLDGHFTVVENFGGEIEIKDDRFRAVSPKPRPASIFLLEASVTATENALLLAAAADGETVIENAASEPHIADLIDVLEKMGAQIEGRGSNFLRIKGQRSLHGFTHSVAADHIEAGTFAIAAACTSSDLEITGVNRDHLRVIVHYLKQMNVDVSYTDNTTLRVRPAQLSARQKKIQTGLWPGFPTDLMSPMIVLATQARGMVLFQDWMYESRMFFVDKLIVMGAEIIQCDPHRVVVSGPARLRSQKLSSPDIRAGIALVIAALAAQGQSIIEHAELIDRGYEDIVQRFGAIGANISRNN